MGGGAAYGTLYNCLVISNSAAGMFGYGGGTYQRTFIIARCLHWGGNTVEAPTMGLDKLVLTGNKARYGKRGGAYYGSLSNARSQAIGQGTRAGFVFQYAQ